MSYRIFELPQALWLNGKPSVQLLCSRNMVTTSRGQLWLGKNFAFAGEPAESYRLLQSFNHFAWHGKLMADYPARTDPFKAVPVIDLSCGLKVQLDGPDLILDEIHDFDAVHGEFLMVVGDEIMFAAQPKLAGVGLYTIKALRGQLGSPIQQHLAGADVFIIRASDVKPLIHPSFKCGNVGKFKVTLGVQQASAQESVQVDYRQG
jgi:hypothetical protein